MHDTESARADALAHLRRGTDALAEGRLDRAAESLVIAETIFSRLNDGEHVARSRAQLAEVQRQSGAVEKSLTSYQRAIAGFQQAGILDQEAAATLAVGHIERQRGQYGTARERYLRAAEAFAAAGRAGGEAAAWLALGHIEVQRGHLQDAAADYDKARRLFARSSDVLGEADAARGTAGALAEQGNADQAYAAYGDALAIYQSRRDVFGQVDALIGQGRARLATRAFDEAGALFGEAIQLAIAAEYDLGRADGTLGLADIETQRGRWDQALANAVQAGERYGAANNALGGAEVNRILGEVQLHRGDLAQAVTDFNRALRTFETLGARRQHVQAALGAGEAQRRRGSARRADELFAEARSTAVAINQPSLEAAALLGLGTLAVQRGHGERAEALLGEARRRFVALEHPTAAALALTESARLALQHGQLDRVLSEVDEAIALAGREQDNLDAIAVMAAARVTLGDALVAFGRLQPARSAYDAADELALRSADPYVLATLALGRAELDLQADDLQGAVGAFNRAANFAQQSGARTLEGLASVGLGRVLLRRELWEEALIAHQEMLSRFREAEDLGAQGLVHLGVGEARRQLGNLTEALESFDQARQVYTSAGAPLGEAAAEQGAARVLEQQSDSAAIERYQRATELTLRVGRAIGDAETRATFFDGRAPLFAEATFTIALGTPEGGARELATTYAAVAGSAGRVAVARRLREYEQSLPVRGGDLSEADSMRNRAARQHLAAARDALK